MAAAAQQQRGNVTRRQLLDAGFSRTMIDRRIRLGSLHRQFPGVYLVGHLATPPFARECAALLACGHGEMLSHRTAARVRGLPVPRVGTIHLTAVGRGRHSPTGIKVHSIRSIGATERERIEGLPITSLSLTLLDLAGCLNAAQLVSALNEARIQKRNIDGALRSTLAAHPNRRGARALARLLASDRAAFVVGSRAEELCLELMLAHDLRPDASQAPIGPYRADFLYEAERLVVEVDGFRFHATPDRFIRDRRRRAHLLAHGYEVFPVTWADLTQQAEVTMERLRSARARRRAQLAR